MNTNRWIWRSVWTVGLWIGATAWALGAETPSQKPSEGERAIYKAFLPVGTPAPVVEAIQKAQEMLMEVYGDRLATVQTIDGKNKLADEMMTLAAEDPDPAHKYVLWEAARQLRRKKESLFPFVLLTPRHATAWNQQWGINDPKSALVPLIPEKWEWCNEYIFTHAPCSLLFRIPPGAKSFSAIGYCMASQDVEFEVLADGHRLFSCKKAGVVPIRVELPPKAQRLELQTNPRDDGTSDHAFWLYPRFHSIPIKKDVSSLRNVSPRTIIPLVRLPFETLRSLPDFPPCVNAVAKTPDSHIVPPVAVESPVRCSEFIYAHAPSRLEFEVPRGARRFTAVGFCRKNNSTRFIVAANGRRLYQSPPFGVVTIDVPLPEDTQQLTLEIDDLGNNAFDQTFWCYPHLVFQQ